MRRASSGFTLLEVLAAVALLGFLFTVLSGAGIQGLRAEGAADNRLRASMVADRVLAELEAGFVGGAVPEIGVEEREEDDFAVIVETSPLRLEIEEIDGDTLPPFLASAAGLGSADDDASPLRTVEVRVAWAEGGPAQQVVRRTFAFDRESRDSELEALGAEPDVEDLEEE